MGTKVREVQPPSDTDDLEELVAVELPAAAPKGRTGQALADGGRSRARLWSTSSTTAVP